VGNGNKGGLGYREAVEFFVPVSKESNYWGFQFQRLKKLGDLKY
jgi:hypothetical protein